jgi:CheY-like chemotaxis protein
MAKILLVDDSDSIRAMLAQALRGAGHEVITAVNGKEGIRLLTSARPALVVSDIFMPEADGLELIVALRGLPHRPPVIAMSSMTGNLDMLRSAKGLGAAITLRKPFPPQELLRAVDQLLAGKAALAKAATGT